MPHEDSHSPCASFAELSPKYQHNLAALRAFQPAVAEVVDAAPVAAGTCLAEGRDGALTFRVPDAHGRLRWFGGSSMPTISASELVGGFQGSGENVAIPGILTGREALLIVERLMPHCALFVIEEDPSQLKLTLHLHDFGEAISRGRLVFLAGDDLTKALTAFVEAHPGYIMPATLLTVPQRAPAEIALLQRTLESAGAAVAKVQERAVEAVRSRFADRRDGGALDRPRVAVVSTDAGELTRIQTGRVERALQELGWEYALCVPDGPGNCHTVARLEAVASARADVVLVLNSLVGPLVPLLPADIPAVSWLLPGTSPASIGRNALPGTAVFASSREYRRLAEAANVTEACVLDSALAADPACSSPTSSPRRRPPAPRAAVMMDLPETRADVLGLTLPSHTALWHSLLEIASAAGPIDDHTAGTWLKRAEQASGTAMSDASVREHFLLLVSTCVIPYTLGVRAAQSLIQSGTAVTVLGSHWPALGGTKAGGPVPMGTRIWDCLRGLEIIVLPNPSSVHVQTALDALALGVEAVCRGSLLWFQQEYPGLGEPARFIRFYETPEQLVEVVRELRYADDAAAAQRRTEARSAVLGGHTVADRLRSMVEAVGAGVATCGPS